MNTMIKAICCVFFVISSLQITAQNKFEQETAYMNCMYSLFDDNGDELKSLIKKAEQSLLAAEVLSDTRGESYLALYKNIRTAIDGRVANFGISDYVIKSLLESKNAKKYSACMKTMMTSENFKDSKLSKIVAMSTSGNNPKITEITGKMLEIFNAADFNHDFYKYLTFSLIDKYNAANQK